MKILFDSNDFCVLHLVANAVQDGTVPPPLLPDHCFEIVDKKANKEIFLRGEWASAFQRQINDWHHNAPAVAEVEVVLGGFCALAQLPVLIH